MKWFVRQHPILLEDKVVIEIDVNLPGPIAASTFNRFPGVEQFRLDVINILESEYGFEVIEDNYGGIEQKGYVSNRDDSLSIYFDMYYDLSKSQPAIDRQQSMLKASEVGFVYCFIHFRFSDHYLYDAGDELHRQFLKRNTNKYVERNPRVNTTYNEEIILPERSMQLYYDEALQMLRNQLDARIVAWVKNAKIILKHRDDE